MPGPTLLAFDTSAAHCAAALLSDGRIRDARVEEMARGQAERLMDLCREVLDAAGLDWQALDGIGVGVGPGNFTGIRISVAAARGLALGLGVPAIGVSRLEAQALDAPRPCRAAIEAPRGAAYVQDFPGGAPSLVPARPEGALPPLDAREEIARIARIAADRLGTDQPRPAPVYVRAADAAPASDPPPVLLP
ncbi:tRNA threonylcarbamoyl adenosine modification protein YeaZ [Wenxinia saemankumensis]|uniref:tRNA threonylcarbamoyl adenosine modification protein YeaZ n=2 Tax=Wenxinia saemankumensis TaxID=1447782 RepID=A0A1M6E0Q4_9RHOB|nr:tRNA threonylcarbamoyl adenosine modification protein YeaZ [Wenxinia saemankumensis]